MMHQVLVYCFQFFQQTKYLGVVILMAMESSITPVPSEIVIPPAAYMAAKGEMNIYGVILAGTFGSWLGAALTFWAAKAFGRALVIRFGKFFMMSESKLDRAEKWLERYEVGGIFFARLLPGIRHVISIPAGIVRMNFTMFSICTILGSAVWCSVLAWLGHRAYQQQPNLIEDPEGLVKFIKHESLTIILVIAALAVLYFVVMKLTSSKGEAKPAS